MDMITGIELGPHPNRAGRSPNHGVKIHNRIKKTACTNPFLNCLPDLFPPFRHGRYSLLRSKGCTNYPDSMGMATFYNLFIACNQIIAGKCIRSFHPTAKINVINAFKEDYPFYTGNTKHVPVETCKGADTSSIQQHLVSGNSLVYNRYLSSPRFFIQTFRK